MNTIRRLALVASALVALAGCGGDELPPLFLDGGSTTMDGGVGPDECVDPMTVCGSQCVNLQTSARNCGSCGNSCSAGSFCDMGTCSSSCSGDQAQCGDSCVDFATDRDHCGRCDNGCREDQVCGGGSCVCATGQRDCDGECADLDENTAHCGACGNACEADEACDDGTCRQFRETVCDDGNDDDADGQTDCQDRDCLGFSRDCDCGTGGEMGEQSCQEDGTFGECRGCPAPECSSEMPCDYGFVCVSGTCEFDESATYDLEIVQVNIDASNVDCSSDGLTRWDPWPNPGADVFLEIEAGPSMVRAPNSGSVLANPDNDFTVMLAEGDNPAVSGVSAQQYLDSFSIAVYDYDTVGANDLVNNCNFGVREESFSGDVQMWTCGPTEGMCDADPEVLPRAGYRIQFRFVEPR